MQHSHSEQLVEKAKFLMEENIYGEINLNSIGEMLGRQHLPPERGVQVIHRDDPYQYFISIKIRKAKELLEGGELPSRRWPSGWGSTTSTISLGFSKNTGIPPSRWSPLVPALRSVPRRAAIEWTD